MTDPLSHEPCMERERKLLADLERAERARESLGESLRVSLFRIETVEDRCFQAEAKLARVVEWLSDPSAHAEDCPTRVDNLAPYMSRTQCLCHVAPLLAAAKGEP
jgi:hypothetical protein